MVLTEEERLQRRRERQKKYRNTEKGKETKKKSMTKYLQTSNGKEKLKKHQLKYQQTTNGKEKLKKRQLIYKQSEKGIKNNFKQKWKQMGLNMENFEEIYRIYQMAIFCDICEEVLGEGNRKKCMDHCHYSGEFRNIVCLSCNNKLPKQL